jgi:hypothetical protein
MSVGFSGTQEGMTIEQRVAVCELLDDVPAKDRTLHEGDCIGADIECCRIAKALGFRIVCHPPLDSTKRAFFPADETWARREYMERNQDIAKMATRLFLATPKDMQETLRSGTWSAVRRARRFQRKIIIVFPDGTRRTE